jgi:exopolysaccharide biosynthesis protein
MARYTTLFVLSIFISASYCFSDFRSKEKISPGVIYYHDHRASGPWHIHIIEIYLGNSAILLESAKAESSLFARQKTSVISKKRSHENHYVVGAINADFFEWNGTPVGAQVINGQLINEPINRSVFGITEDNKPFISIVNWMGYLELSNNTIYELKGLNKRRNTNEWYLYNHFYTDDTLSFKSGLLLHAKLLSDKYTVNDSMEFQITKVVDKEGVIIKPDRMKDEENLLIGPANEPFDFKLDDRLQILMKLDPLKENVEMMIGGLPRIIRDGNMAIDWKKENIRESFSSKRHPRTSVGFTIDKQKVIFFVVDGRQPGYSAGMTLPELATYMLEWEIYQGVNLDGGGSSTMVIGGEVANRPSDTSGERPVANALLVINTEERDITTKLNIIPDEVMLSPGRKFQFEVDLRDTNYLPVSNQIDSTIWSCDLKVGVVDSSGLFTVDSSVTTGILYVQKGMMIDSAKVSIIKKMESIHNKQIFEMDH